MAKPRIFVSSTCYDLKHIRASLENFIESLGFEAILSEKGDIPYSHDQALDESCYREVRTCDVFVSILGGRYGSEKSANRTEKEKEFFDRYDSVTKEEYKVAREQDIPIYIFIEKAVFADYEMFQKNRDNKSVIYPHVDSVNTLMLIEEILKQPRNNPIQKFERYTEIEEWLRSQWAGLFRDLLRSRSKDKQLLALESQVRELGALNQTLKSYLEHIVTKVVPKPEEIIRQEDQKLLKAAQMTKFVMNPFVRHLHEDHSMTVNTLVDVFRRSSTIEELCKNLDSEGLHECYASDLDMIEKSEVEDINEARKSLNLEAFPPIATRQKRSKSK